MKTYKECSKQAIDTFKEMWKKYVGLKRADENPVIVEASKKFAEGFKKGAEGFKKEFDL